MLVRNAIRLLAEFLYCRFPKVCNCGGSGAVVFNAAHPFAFAFDDQRPASIVVAAEAFEAWLGVAAVLVVVNSIRVSSWSYS